tara:strand:- start:1512 stop:2867 length:1356 start_codon:yes stop_codon:yes gene_type:complete
MKNQSKRREDNSSMRKKSSDKQRPHDISEKLTKQSPMSMRDWGQVTLYWLALVLLGGVIGCAGCQTKTTKFQRKKNNLKTSRLSPPSKRMSSSKEYFAKPRITVKNILHFKPSTPDTHFKVQQLFNFNALVSNTKVIEGTIFGEKYPRLLSIQTQERNQYFFTFSKKRTALQRINKPCQSGVPDKNGNGVLFFKCKRSLVGSSTTFVSTMNKTIWSSNLCLSCRGTIGIYFFGNSKRTLWHFSSIEGASTTRDLSIIDSHGKALQKSLGFENNNEVGHITKFKYDLISEEIVYVKKGTFSYITRRRLSDLKTQWKIKVPQENSVSSIVVCPKYTLLVLKNKKRSTKQTFHRTLRIIDKNGELLWSYALKKHEDFQYKPEHEDFIKIGALWYFTKNKRLSKNVPQKGSTIKLIPGTSNYFRMKKSWRVGEQLFFSSHNFPGLFFINFKRLHK